MQNMSVRLRQAREYSGMTQTELGRATKTSLRQVQNWEAGQSFPSSLKVVAIAKATGVTVNFLLGDLPRLPTTWAPWTVIPTTPNTPETAEEAKRLLDDATGEEWEYEEVQEQIKGGWITFENGALVVWQDGDRDPDTDLLYQMLVK